MRILVRIIGSHMMLIAPDMLSVYANDYSLQTRRVWFISKACHSTRVRIFLCWASRPSAPFRPNQQYYRALLLAVLAQTKAVVSRNIHSQLKLCIRRSVFGVIGITEP